MTQEEKNTPITFGMLESIFKGIEEPLTSNINALNDIIEKRCGVHEKSILKLMDMCSKITEELNVLRAFVIAVYADQNLLSVEKAAQVYRDYSTKFNKIVKEVKED